MNIKISVINKRILSVNHFSRSVCRLVYFISKSIETQKYRTDPHIHRCTTGIPVCVPMDSQRILSLETCTVLLGKRDNQRAFTGCRSN